MDPQIGKPVSLLRAILGGGSISHEELQHATWLAEGSLDRLIADAWLEMQQWVADADIRSQDAEYASMRLERLRWFLREIEREAVIIGLKI